MEAKRWQRFKRWLSLLLTIGLVKACVGGVAAPITGEQPSSSGSRGGELIVGFEIVNAL